MTLCPSFSRTAAALAAVVAMTSCGGGVGEVLVATFLGAGGGNYLLQLRNPGPPAGYDPFDETVTLSLTPLPDINTGQPDLYATAYDVYAINGTGRLASCSNRLGRVDGRRLSIPNCFSGNFDSVNRIVSDDGSQALILGSPVTPNLTSGLWVDVNDTARAYKFALSAGNTVACEFSGSTKRAAAVDLRRARVEVSAPILTLTEPAITRLAIAGGSTWTGEFIGISALRLTSGSTQLELQRRNQNAPAPCP